MSKQRTHWEGCEVHPGHSECAKRVIDELRADNERLWDQIDGLDDDLIEKDAQLKERDAEGKTYKGNTAKQWYQSWREQLQGHDKVIKERDQLRTQNAALIAAIADGLKEHPDTIAGNHRLRHLVAAKLTEAQDDE